MTVEVIVPYRETWCPHRRAALAWVIDRLVVDGWSATIAADPDPTGPWVKANVVMPAIERSTADVVVVHDADVAVGGLRDAVEALQRGAAWSVPHGPVHRLTRASTEQVLAGADPTDGDLDEAPYWGIASGGAVAVRRDVALDIPMDPRFVGWGGEDHAWGYALHVLHGTPWRGDRPLWHLWHPPQPRVDRMVGSEPSERLRRRYRDACLASEMRAIIEEIPWRRSPSS